MKNPLCARRIPLLAGITGAVLLATALLSLRNAADETAGTALPNLSIHGGIDEGKAKLLIEALLSPASGHREKLIFATALNHRIQANAERLEHTFQVAFEILQGEPKELALTIEGSGQVRQVTGDWVLDWGVRQNADGGRLLVIRPKSTRMGTNHLSVEIRADQPVAPTPSTVPSITLVPPHAVLFHGFVAVQAEPALAVRAGAVSGLMPVGQEFLPDALRIANGAEESAPLAFRFQGMAYALTLELAWRDPEAGGVVLRDFQLTGEMDAANPTFTLSATARVQNPNGGELALLEGAIALIDCAPAKDWDLRFDGGRFILKFARAGEFPLRLRFNAAAQSGDGWNHVDFRVAPSALQPVTLKGLAAETQFLFKGGARPERRGDDFVSHLAPDGAVQLGWKQVRAETEGKLFYAAEMLTQVGISPGVMRQLALLDYKVMQGELNQLVLLLHGPAEITRVQGEQVLSWKVDGVEPSGDRRLIVQLNQPEKDRVTLQLQLQTPLGAFPQTAEPTGVRPVDATRFAGYFRIVNEGAVRLEVLQATGLSQVSPEQFPETDITKALFRSTGGQRFAYRFSGVDAAVRIRADQVLPELSVSEVLTYHLGENEQSLEAEIELEIREAPVRELLLQIPKGYAVARLTVPGLSDYFTQDRADRATTELRLVYGQPASGRQVLQLRLERNQTVSGTNWAIPRLEVADAKSIRGHVGLSADAGIRLTPGRTTGLTELATAFFPRKIAGLQLAFRLNDPSWDLSVIVERLPQTVQADALHLFSVGEGIAYGSSVINYVVSSAPVSLFRLELSSEYYNVEFTGKDIRNWQKTTNGYVIQLHTPVAGTYTLLATYERPFRPQGETLTFTGARPVDTQPEQGYTLVTSGYQFRVQPVEVSPGLLPLEAGEVPPEYRLFFDSPILAAYRYTSRPFNLRLALSPIAQGESLSQVVDRASLRTRIAKTGQVLTDVHYFVKNRGHPHFRLALPEGTLLWSATVNGTAVVPVTDAKDNLIPLPQRLDPNAVITVDLQLASPSNQTQRLKISAPIVAAPVMLAEWQVTADTGQRLIYKGGSLTPASGMPDTSGFPQIWRAFTSADARQRWVEAAAALALLGLALGTWRWTLHPETQRFSPKHLSGTLVGTLAFALSLTALLSLAEASRHQSAPVANDLSFVAPVQEPSHLLSVELATVEAGYTFSNVLGYGWPAIFGLGLACVSAILWPRWLRSSGWLLVWLLLLWVALRWQNGAPGFFFVLIAFLIVHVAFPAWRQLSRLPRREEPTGLGTTPLSGPSSAALVLPFILSIFVGGPAARANESPAIDVPTQAIHPLLLAASGAPPSLSIRASTNAILPASVFHRIEVDEPFALGTTRIVWQAKKGETLLVLASPAVLTGIDYPTNQARLVSLEVAGVPQRRLLAESAGQIQVEVRYQVAIQKREGETGFNLPTSAGLIHRLDLLLKNLDVDVASSANVFVQRQIHGTNTQAEIVLSPEKGGWVAWKPRSRDLRQERALFYAEFAQLYSPSAGVIEGVHVVAIRPAQGELSELTFQVPTGTTITDVLDPVRPAKEGEKKKAGPQPVLISLWRFDPDTRRLRVSLRAAQSRPFTLEIRSQVATGPLPYEQSVGTISVEGAAGQVGLLAIATGTEIQLDTVIAEGLSTLNLEDFPPRAVQVLQSQIPGLAVRRAFRYADATARTTVKASAVQPDVRVESQQTLSLGEDRTLLALTARVAITRAGIFRFSFVVPPSFDVESISGEAMSHWTELKIDAQRVVTLHLKGRSEGEKRFAISLTGPGLKPTKAWSVPQVLFREAVKQQGSLLIVPEQGMRLQVVAREGTTQLDPQRSGVKQKGVLSFRVLQVPWNLVLDIEPVEAWIQVNSLQHSIVNEALVKVTANLQYQIENTGLKLFRVGLPPEAEGVRFRGEQIADFRAATEAGLTNGLRIWEVKLHRRVLGNSQWQVTYQLPLADQAIRATLQGIQPMDVNLHRGFVTVQSAGRLQLRAENVPGALQPAEWQNIPKSLQLDLAGASANLAYRLLETAYQLPLTIERHAAAKLLPARVQQVTMSSVISDNGVMLTQVRMDLLAGDKRLLHLTLPKEARFWFAFVDQTGVWPWREQDQILLPLDSQSHTGKSIALEFFYTSQIGSGTPRALDLELLAPKFDLPLEDVTWRVYLNEKWEVQKWAGSMQLAEQEVALASSAANMQIYLQNEAAVQRQKTKDAEQMLAFGNTALVQGNPDQARRAFRAAFGLSQGDNAFNEDARVQLNNLKVQQALVGLNVRQANVAGESDLVASKLRETDSGRQMNYSQQEAKALIEKRGADESAAFMRLAQRLIDQQDAAVNIPAAIHASIPEQGRVLTFKRAVVVDTWADLRIKLTAKAIQSVGLGARMIVLLGVVLLLLGSRWAIRPILAPRSL